MKMEVFHSTKVTHNFTASKKHIGGFFEALSRMCEDQTYTDLHLVAGDGQIFAAHQIIVGSCSALIKEESENPKLAENLTVYLPDFSSGAIKSLLCLMYTGSSGDECSQRELKQLLLALRIELKVDSGNNVSLAPLSFSSSLSYSSRKSAGFSNGYDDRINSSFGNSLLRNKSSLLSGMSNHRKNQLLNNLMNNGNNEDPDNNEILEVTPDFPMFGNHFLSNDHSLQNDQEENGLPNSFYQAGGDSKEDSGSKGFLCRLCGRNTPSTASLFAHFLYPHYAHLWRTEIPQRKNKYDCEREGCNYTTKNRQHFVMHVARVHDDLRIKMEALGENLEILDNLDAKHKNACTDRIYSKHAKMRHSPEDKGLDGDESVNGFLGGSVHGSPNAANSPKFMNLHDGEMTLSPIKFQSPNPSGLVGGKTVRCRLCGKCWKGKDTSNFFTHMVSTHFKYLWSAEVPKSADMYNCHVPGCDYRTKYRYNFLFHLAGRHKQLKEKLSSEGISASVIKPVRTDETNEHLFQVQKLSNFLLTNNEEVAIELMKRFAAGTSTNKMLVKAKKKKKGRPPKGKGPTDEQEYYFGGGSPAGAAGGNGSAFKNDQIKLICRICKKISLNHTCHRQHVVHKHFNHFWSSHTTDEQGQFRCHHQDCNYATPNRSVFVIHLAYKHFELKSKLESSGNDPGCADPDVYGKRKYRRNAYDNTMHQGGPVGISKVNFAEGESPSNNDPHHPSLPVKGSIDWRLMKEVKEDEVNVNSSTKSGSVDEEHGLMPSSENGGSEYTLENENPYAAMRDYADYKHNNDFNGPNNPVVEDGEPEIDGQEYPEYDIDDEMEEHDDLGDVDEQEGEDEFEEDGFQAGEADDITVDEMDGLNVGEIDVPSDVEGESDDEVQIQ